MNFLQRLVLRWWSLWAATFGVETGRLVPLPRPLVNPRVPAAELIAEADARGVADAESAMMDPWSFGGPDDPASDLFDPGYIRALRHQREAATAALHESQRLTDARVAPMRRLRDESNSRMNDARARMAGLAVRDRTREALSLDDLDPATPAPDPADGDDDTPWEGETSPLNLAWRLLIVAGLVVAELPVQFYVFDYFLGAGAGGLVRWMALFTSAILVVGPFVAGVLLRNRQATGAERRIGYAIIALGGSWLFVAAVLGLIRGRVLEADAAHPERLHIAPVTIVLMFVALLLVVGAMSFMLGLARRHPFQEAYVRQRNRRDRFDMLMRATATRINPAYRDPDNDAPALTEQDERAIRESYAAAEDAYFAALVRTVGDPTFTEAVQQRRGLRTTP